jgi:polyhydroxyalkanoate synthesis regulator phasin
MAEPDNIVLQLLREIRAEQQLHTQKFDGVERAIREANKRIDNLRNAMTGESVLGRYAVAEVDERLDAIEKRLERIEKRN